MEKKKEKKKFTQEDIMQLLNSLYEKAVDGIDQVDLKKIKVPFDAVFPPVNVIAEDYLSKHDSIEKAAKSFTHYQIAKCTTAGFLAGLGGIITLPVAVPANIASVMFVQMQMIATLAHMGGYDVKSDQVKTMVFVCLAGISVDQILKQSGIQIGEKVALGMVKKIPGEVLTKINQKVGFRFITKFGEKGVINLGKTIPVIGGFVSGGFDAVETTQIANRAYKMFIEGKVDDDVVDMDFTDIDSDVIEVDFTEVK